MSNELIADGNMEIQHIGKDIFTKPALKMVIKKVKKIKQLLKIGERGTVIAKKFNVTTFTISDIKRGKSWKHI